jgi:hypothetical protein
MRFANPVAGLEQSNTRSGKIMLRSVKLCFAAAMTTVLVTPVHLDAQQRTPPTQRSTQPWQCTPRDSLRSFNRSLRLDSVSRTRQATNGNATPITGGTTRSQEYPEYDVVLDIPNLCVNRIFLKVDSLTAKLNLDARVANLVHVQAGADVLVGNVDLTIEGVRAQALLLVDLDDVVYIVDQTLTFVDNHPEIVQQLGSTLQNTVGTVGGLAGQLLLGVTKLANGSTVQRMIDQATGRIIEKTVNAAGTMIAQKTVGAITSLPIISNTTNAAGQAVKRVRDNTGAVIEYTLDRAGKLLNSRIVQAATNR